MASAAAATVAALAVPSGAASVGFGLKNRIIFFTLEKFIRYLK